MAEEKETLLFEVILDIPQVKEKAELARVAIAQLRKEKAATEKEFKEKSIGAEEYAKSMQAIDTQLTRAQGQLKGYQKTLADNDKATKSAAGSNDQLRAQLSLIVPQLNAMGKAQRQNSVEGKYFEDQVRRLNAELKENEEAVGDHRRSVGDYAKGLRVAGISLGEVQEAVKGGVEAFQVFTKGITVTRGALIALSAIPILLLLTGLVALLTKSQAGMDKLAQYTKAFDLALSSVTQGFVKIGQATAVFFSAETFSSWDKMKEKAIALKDAYFGVADGVAAAAKAGIDIEKTNQRIEDSEIKLNVVRAKSRAEVERLKLLAEDTSKSTTVRAAAAKKAFEIENNLMKQQSTLQKERIANAEREYELSGKTREDARKVAEERVRLAEIEEDSLGKQTELNNNLNSIRTEGITKAKEAAALAAQEEISHYERLIVLAKQKGEDTLLLEEALIKKKGAAEALETKKGSEKRKLIEVQTNAEILSLRVAHAVEMQNRVVEARRNELSASLAIARAGSKEELQLQIESVQAETKARLIEIEAQRKLNKITEEEEFKARANAVLTGGKAIDALRQQFDEATVQREAAMIEDQLIFEENANDVRMADLRGLAADRIKLERDTQIQLLDIALKYNKITQDEYDSKLDAIEAKAAGANRELNRLINEDELKDAKARIESRMTQVRAGSKQELQVRIDAINNERMVALNVAKLTVDEKKAINDKANKAILDAEKEFSKQLLSNVLDSASSSVDALSRLTEAQINTANALFEKQQSAALASAGLSAEARTKIEEKFAARKEELDRKAAERRRKIATIENIIATARAVTEAQILPPPFDIIKTVLAVATGAAQQAVIASQQFARGGEIDGPSHAEGGVKYRIGRRTVELEGGEGVINKHAMRIPAVRQKASELNQMAGNGVPFPGTMRISAGRLPSYNPNRLEYGGIISGASGGSSIDYTKIGSLVSQMVVKAVAAMPAPIVGVQDIQAGVGRRVRVEQRAEIGL